MSAIFSDLRSAISNLETARIEGRVQSVVGLSLMVSGLERAAGIGQRCRVHGRHGLVTGEVVGAGDDGLRLLPFGTWDGIAVGDRVDLVQAGDSICPDESWIGTVIDALGRPLSPAPAFRSGSRRARGRNSPLPAYERRRVGDKLETQIKCIDLFTPICRGQRMGVFAGSGVGKSTLMAMLARNTDADVIVIGLVGERGREVQDFIKEDLGEQGMARSIVVVATGDEAPLLRRQAAWTATAVAEHFRDAGKQVLLMMDSVTRFAMAQREIGLSSGEPPTTRGYPPTVFSELPHLLERAGPGREGQGDITGVYTVLVDGDDMNEPIADAVRGILDGHIVLDRRIAEQDRYPAINVQRSISRMLPECHSAEEYRIMQAARRALARYSDMEELIRVGAYTPGSDPETDAAARFFSAANLFLAQTRGTTMRAEQSFADLYRMLLEAGIDVPIAPAPAAETKTGRPN
ncbi:FliI/YscN family ATPase [Antarcticimicrobium sediminis]|uniref:Flagellar protein export ATPase FliI n=1 Tax=Antarcticimicrobium sediminis TaxID=2546227 RepID=A0A4R5EVN1_9RHOB|nr:FliI/YscN family ATPase [Antarcticimicrobium sediminis]TDE38892.1 flagellar protein export ATPase FliI [Antarcticimicrobium sediminis]